MKNEFDKRLTDKGWKSMRRLLDQAMPEQRRRRRFAWWLFGLFLLPAAGVGGWWMWQQSNPAPNALPPVDTPKTVEPVVQAGTSNNLSGATAAAQENLLGAAPHAGAITPIEGVAPSLTFSPSAAAVGEKYSISTQSVVGENASNDTNTKHGGDEIISAQNLEKPQYLTGFEKSSNFHNLLVSPQFIENQIKNTPKFPTVATYAPEPVKKITTPNRWSFGLTAGLVSENLSKLNGASAGIAMDWQFARKWGLRSGLQYAQYRFSDRERPVVSLDDDAYVEATGNFNVILDDSTSLVSSPSTQPLTVLVPVEKQHRLEMPLLAYWQPIRPLRVFGGISLSYNFATKASSQGFANNKQYDAGTQAARDNLNKLTADALPRHLSHLQLGLGLRLGKRVELDVFYKKGLAGKVPDTAQSADIGSNGNIDPEIIGQSNRSGGQSWFVLNGILFF